MCDGGDNGEGSLEGLVRAVEQFLAGPPVAVTAYELGERLIRLRHGIDLLELGFAREVAGAVGPRGGGAAGA